MSDTYFEEEEFETQFNGRTIARILAQARPHWRLLAGFLALLIAVSLIDGYFTFLTRELIDKGIANGDRPLIIRILTLYGGLVVLSSSGVFGFIYLTALLGERVRYDLRRAMFEHLQELSFSYFDRTPVGWIMSRVMSDSERIADLVTWGVLDTAWGIVSITISVGFMLFINWRLALVVIVLIPVLVIVAAEFKRHILTAFRGVRRLNSQITGAFNEKITGVRVTKAVAREETDLREFQELTGDMFAASFRAAWLGALFLPVVQLLSAVGVAAVAWYGGWLSLDGGITVGDIQAFVGYITFMLWPVEEMARVYAQLQQSVASGERVFSLLDSVPEMVDQPNAFDPGRIRGEIRYEDVDFAYEADNPVLADFNLHVRAGETIALVGPTGGGKSTIVNLAARFYDPTAGRILVDGRDLTSLSRRALQAQLGIVLQTPHLFSGTVAENIRYGRLDAEDDAVIAAAQMAGADDFIGDLPQGYEEQVGEGGSLLSTGQKQLISLARAILADPAIFIMDEATSSVDTLTEALIQRAMDRLLSNRTSFVIAHRLSTIRRADRILVIEDGRIAEMGSHAELLRRQGHYYRLYSRQFRREREAVLGQIGNSQLTTSK